MLCGTLICFLTPETKGRTLEDLAREPTSSMDGGGRNGSVVTRNDSPWWKWNPFPGVFSWKQIHSPSMGPMSPRLRGKKERVGIMTSPNLLPKEKEGKHGRAVSDTTSANGACSVSMTSSWRMEEEHDEVYVGAQCGVRSEIQGEMGG